MRSSRHDAIDVYSSFSPYVVHSVGPLRLVSSGHNALVYHGQGQSDQLKQRPTLTASAAVITTALRGRLVVAAFFLRLHMIDAILSTVEGSVRYSIVRHVEAETVVGARHRPASSLPRQPARRIRLPNETDSTLNGHPRRVLRPRRCDSERLVHRRRLREGNGTGCNVCCSLHSILLNAGSCGRSGLP